jgi:hypothetical protein
VVVLGDGDTDDVETLTKKLQQPPYLLVLSWNNSYRSVRQVFIYNKSAARGLPYNTPHHLPA